MSSHAETPDRTTEERDDEHAKRASRAWWILAAIALFYLLSEHRAHLFGALPYLLLLACPLMHFFMHGGHGHDERRKGDNESR